jgi:hypothetical protein
LDQLLDNKPWFSWYRRQRITPDGSAFVSGTTDVVVLALQGTGDFTDATVEGLTGTPTATIVAVFDQNYQ